ncbi:MAG: hypothetical protein Ct9H300mP29_4080 [Candidatus Neomarinimicrobiota bacterium]|nr:MAG: hypothetical protein Ct9H300mP29_4080 [Candidatus Neomarinimicrobiota bacterium]
MPHPLSMGIQRNDKSLLAIEIQATTAESYLMR